MMEGRGLLKQYRTSEVAEIMGIQPQWGRAPMGTEFFGFYSVPYGNFVMEVWNNVHEFCSK